MKLGLILLVAVLSIAVAQTTTKKASPTTTKKPTGQTTTKNASPTTTKKVSASGESFEDWKKRNKKNYTSSSSRKTETEAEKTFKTNAAKISQHNQNANATYKQAANANADMTPDEIKKNRKGYKPDNAKMKSQFKGARGGNGSSFNPSAASQNLKRSMPSTYDLTSAMSPVKDQLACGSCWAFAAVGVMEYWSKLNGTNQIFSEQNLVDCDTNSGGCDGGNPLYGFYYSINSGIADGNQYSYQQRQMTCQSSTYPPIYHLSNACYFSPAGNEETLKTLLVKYGPVVVGIHTTGTGFDFYSSGVFYSTTCSSDQSMADHAVVVVGYGTDATGGDYWIVRNSWGTSFGLDGYIYMARNQGNHCGIANAAFTVCPA